MDETKLDDDRFYGATYYYVKNSPAAEKSGLPAIEMAKYFRRSLRNTNTLNIDFKKILTGKTSAKFTFGSGIY